MQQGSIGKWRDRKAGASLLGYGLVIGLISVVALGAITSVGDQTNGLFTSVSGTLDGVASGSGAGAGGGAGGSGSPDGSTPSITGISGLGGIYLAAQDTLSLTITLDEPVTVSGGVPSIPITLDDGGGTVEAQLSGATSGTALTFSYSPVTGDADYDGIAIGSQINLNGATILDAQNNPLPVALGGVTLAEVMEVHFNPGAELSGLVAWWDASDASTITLGAGGVQGWASKQGGLSVTQGSTGLQPDVLSGQLNGRDVLDFDGNERLSRNGGVLSAGDDTYTFAAVWQVHNNSQVHIIMEQNTTASTANRRGSMLVFSSQYGFNGQNNDAHSMVPYAANSWNSTVMRVNNASNPNILVEHNTSSYSGSTSSPGSLNLGADGFAVGYKYSTGTEVLNGKIAELLVFSNDLNGSDTILLREYLRAKWGL